MEELILRDYEKFQNCRLSSSSFMNSHASIVGVSSLIFLYNLLVLQYFTLLRDCFSFFYFGGKLRTLELVPAS